MELLPSDPRYAYTASQACRLRGLHNLPRRESIAKTQEPIQRTGVEMNIHLQRGINRQEISPTRYRCPPQAKELTKTSRWIVAAVLTAGLLTNRPGLGQEDTATAGEPETKVEDKASLPPLTKPWTRLGEGKNKVWINQTTKQVAVEGEVCLTKGYLEMFACILGTKEHESVVALHSQAFVIHAGLVGIGAKPGSPAQWRPTYKPAQGTVVNLEMEWMDKQGKRMRAPAQKWVRDLKTKKAMSHDWVFAGSLFWVDPDSKQRYYRAEGGEVVCVSNFPVSMLDIPIESSQSNAELGFEVFAENVPPRRTPVRMYFTPQMKADASKTKQTIDAVPAESTPDP